MSLTRGINYRANVKKRKRERKIVRGGDANFVFQSLCLFCFATDLSILVTNADSLDLFRERLRCLFGSYLRVAEEVNKLINE